MKSKVAILLIIVFLLNGLNDARQLNDLSILSAVGIDIDENGEYIITSQVLNTQKQENSSGGETGGTSVVVYETKRKSIHEALRNTIEKAPKKLYIAHLELLMLSEKAASNDILDTLDFFLRDNEGSNDFMIVVTKDNTPQEILSTLSATHSDPAKAIFESIKSTYEYEAATTDYLLYDSLDMILNHKRGIVLASMSLDKHDEIEGDKKDKKEEDSSSEQGGSGEEKSGSGEGGSSSSSNQASTNHFKVTDLAYCKDRKFVDYMDKNDGIIYNLLQNKIKSTVLSMGEGEDLLVLEVNKAKAKLQPRFEEDHFVIDIDVKAEANVTEAGEKVRNHMSKNTDQFKREAEDTIKGKIQDAIDHYQNVYQEDIIGFENLIYKKLNQKYKEVEADFKEKYFPNIKVNINVKMDFPLEGGDMIDE